MTSSSDRTGAPGALLARRLGTTDAVLVGLGAMLGAGIFSAPAPAARAAGPWLPLAVVVAAFVAWCNATSTARLAAVYPQAGGTYVYAGRLLGRAWGHLAGWGFVVGKTASCAAMALTVGVYAWPARPRLAGTVALLVAVALGTGGVQRGARLNRALLTATILVGPGRRGRRVGPRSRPPRTDRWRRRPRGRPYRGRAHVLRVRGVRAAGHPG